MMLNRRTRRSLPGWTDWHWRRRLHTWTLLEGLASMTKVSRRRRRAVRHVKTRTWSEVAWWRSIAAVLRIIAPDVRWLRIARWREGGEATVLRRWALTLAMWRTRGVLEINRQLKVRQSMFSNINCIVIVIRRKATENFHSSLRFRNRSVIYIRYVSS
jgi:hypothetical protein